MNFNLKMILLQARHPIATAKLMTKIIAVILADPGSPSNAGTVLDLTIEFFEETKRPELIPEYADQVLTKLNEIQNSALRIGTIAASTMEFTLEFHKVFSQSNSELRARLEDIRAKGQVPCSKQV